jgi:hypothetical protein
MFSFHLCYKGCARNKMAWDLEWIDLSQDKDKRWTTVKTAMKYEVP